MNNTAVKISEVSKVCDRIEYQFFANSDAANAYLESLADKRGVMVKDSNLEDIFVELMGHQLN